MVHFHRQWRVADPWTAQDDKDLWIGFMTYGMLHYCKSLLCVSREDILAHHAEAVLRVRPDIRVEWMRSTQRVASTAAAINEFLG
jgi:hypothetical protein